MKKYHIDGPRFLVSAGQSDTSRPKLPCTCMCGCKANWSALSLRPSWVNVCLQGPHRTLCFLQRFGLNPSLITSEHPSTWDTPQTFFIDAKVHSKAKCKGETQVQFNAPTWPWKIYSNTTQAEQKILFSRLSFWGTEWNHPHYFNDVPLSWH